MTEWIKTSDRMPATGSWVLAVSTLDIWILFYDGINATGHHWLEEGDWNAKVTHWMPLPRFPDDK